MISKQGKRLAWGVAIAAVLILLSPVLFMAFLMGNNLVSALLTPTRDAALIEPTGSALAGTYVSLSSTITLKADHTFTVTQLPSFNVEGRKNDCSWSGMGRWTIASSHDLSLQFRSSFNRNGMVYCSDGTPNSRFTILGQKRLKLYLTIGDPDSGEGLEFVKIAR